MPLRTEISDLGWPEYRACSCIGPRFYFMKYNYKASCYTYRNKLCCMLLGLVPVIIIYLVSYTCGGSVVGVGVLAL